MKSIVHPLSSASLLCLAVAAAAIQVPPSLVRDDGRVKNELIMDKYNENTNGNVAEEADFSDHHLDWLNTFEDATPPLPQHQIDHQMVALKAIQELSLSIPAKLLYDDRILEGVDPVFDQTGTPLNVVTTCAAYNDAGGFDCVCERSGTVDVFIDCDILNLPCLSDNSTCFQQRFTSILDGTYSPRDGSSGLKASRMSTCTKEYEGDYSGIFPDVAPGTFRTPRFGEVCVDIEPLDLTKPGVFNGTIVCGASMDGNLCNPCVQCKEANSNTTSISIDCSNVVANARVNCAIVDQATGITLPFFDFQGTDSGGVVTAPMSLVVVLMVTAAVAWFGM
mmetsp:Transcript_19836/g.25539  ORF Transcript_19836/g.25539 Transcript_19836/m.25539 type:complete len:335 (-) Transcript_19836:142-1146(-)